MVNIRKQQGKFRASVLKAGRQMGQVTCPHCGVWLDWESSLQFNSAEADHIIPISQGGGWNISNGQVLCRSCNLKKGSGSQKHIKTNLKTPIINSTSNLWLNTH